jgi:hypothetical protein
VAASLCTRSNEELEAAVLDLATTIDTVSRDYSQFFSHDTHLGQLKHFLTQGARLVSA